MSLLANNHLFDKMLVENELIVSVESDFVSALPVLDLKIAIFSFNVSLLKQI